MFITILILSVLLIGLVLLGTGIVVFLKAKNKIAGWIMIAIGLVFTLISSGILLMLAITASTISMG